MSLSAHAVICPRCDALHHRPDLEAGHSAHCTRCGHALIRSASASIGHVLVLSITALVSFVLALTLPALSVTIQGNRIDMTLWRVASGLTKGAWSLVAYPVAMLVVLAPVIQVAMLGWVISFAWRGVRAPGAMRIVDAWKVLRVCTGADVIATAWILAAVQMMTMAGADAEPGKAMHFLAAGCVLAFLAGCRDPQPLVTQSGALHGVGIPVRS